MKYDFSRDSILYSGTQLFEITHLLRMWQIQSASGCPITTSYISWNITIQRKYLDLCSNLFQKNVECCYPWYHCYPWAEPHFTTSYHFHHKGKYEDRNNFMWAKGQKRVIFFQKLSVTKGIIQTTCGIPRPFQ